MLYYYDTFAKTCSCILNHLTLPQAVEPSALSASVSHFLNCFLSSFADAGVIQQNDKLASRRRSRRRRSRACVGGTVTVWSNLTPSDLWMAIKTEAQEYYHYSLPWWVWPVLWTQIDPVLWFDMRGISSPSGSGSVEEAVDKCRLQRITLLREIAIKTGIQVYQIVLNMI